MDDKNFNQTFANEWIRIIEDPSANIRENDLYPLIREWVQQTKAKNILDLGCGQGICSTKLGDSQISYVGVDPSPDLIFRAKELYSQDHRTFVVGNVYSLPFQNLHFDAVFSIAVWHLLSDIAKASSELSRVLKDKGNFLIVTADPNQYPTWTEKFADQKLNGQIFSGTHFNSDGTTSIDTLYLYSMDEIISSFNIAGLTITHIQVVRSLVAISGYKT